MRIPVFVGDKWKSRNKLGSWIKRGRPSWSWRATRPGSRVFPSPPPEGTPGKPHLRSLCLESDCVTKSGQKSSFAMSPSYYFRIDYIREHPSHKPLVDAVGTWYPPKSLGMNQMIGGGVSGLYWYCNGHSISQVAYLPDKCPHFKTFSVYHHNGIFWASKCDATAVQVGESDDDTGDQDSEDATEGEDEGWHLLSFDYEDEENGQQTYSSYITNAGQHNRLRTQRSNQTWPRMLLPKHYHAPEPSRTNDQYLQYGGLMGELPLFLALIAFSVDAEYVSWALQTCFRERSWRTHNIDHLRQDGRGMVVRVYCVPGMDAAELTRNAAELTDYENGVWGKYFN